MYNPKSTPVTGPIHFPESQKQQIEVAHRNEQRGDQSWRTEAGHGNHLTRPYGRRSLFAKK